MDIEQLGNSVRDIVAMAPEVVLVYLFGSRVDGEIGPLSDHDFGVLVEHGRSGYELRMELVRSLGKALDTPSLDVVLLNDAPIELAYAVIAQGYLLYERDLATRVEYEAQVLGRYGDYLPVLRAQRADILGGEDHATRVQRYRAALGRTERTLGEIRAAQEQTATGV